MRREVSRVFPRLTVPQIKTFIKKWRLNGTDVNLLEEGLQHLAKKERDPRSLFGEGKYDIIDIAYDYGHQKTPVASIPSREANLLLELLLNLRKELPPDPELLKVAFERSVFVLVDGREIPEPPPDDLWKLLSSICITFQDTHGKKNDDI